MGQAAKHPCVVGVSKMACREQSGKVKVYEIQVSIAVYVAAPDEDTALEYYHDAIEPNMVMPDAVIHEVDGLPNYHYIEGEVGWRWHEGYARNQWNSKNKEQRDRILQDINIHPSNVGNIMAGWDELKPATQMLLSRYFSYKRKQWDTYIERKTSDINNP